LGAEEVRRDLKPGYKQTEVGVVPEDWGVYTIQDLIEQRAIIGHLDGNHGELYPRSHEFASFGIPYITANDLTGSSVSFKGCKFLPEKRASRFRKGIAKSGDVLFAHNATVGPTGLLLTDLDYVILSTTATYFRCDLNTLSNVFFLYLLQSPLFVPQYQAVMSQSTRNQVPITAQRKLLIALPPTLAEQEAIAEALNDADALIDSLEQLIAKKRLLKQGAMQDLLTGKRRLPGFEGEWEVKKLGEIAHIKTGSRNNQDKVEDGMYPFFVRSATVERINSFSHDCEAILIPGEGGIGSIFHYINGRFDVHQRVYAITQFVNSVSGKYVYLYMSEHFGAHAMENSVKATVDSLRLPTFQNFSIGLPPTLPEQTAIAAILSDMDAELAALEAKLAKARQIKQGMMQELLTGKTRLV
jgi:type I restriction enzyme S subunit